MTGHFHHETRGPDGVTYGCYGWIGPDDLLRVVHYVADAYGYRTVEPEKDVEVYPDTGDQTLQNIDEGGKPRTGHKVRWQDLYFPKGCGKIEGGVRPNIPVIKLPEGGYVNVSMLTVPPIEWTLIYLHFVDRLIAPR